MASILLMVSILLKASTLLMASTLLRAGSHCNSCRSWDAVPHDDTGHHADGNPGSVLCTPPRLRQCRVRDALRSYLAGGRARVRHTLQEDGRN